MMSAGSTIASTVGAVSPTHDILTAEWSQTTFLHLAASVTGTADTENQSINCANSVLNARYIEGIDEDGSDYFWNRGPYIGRLFGQKWCSLSQETTWFDCELNHMPCALKCINLRAVQTAVHEAHRARTLELPESDRRGDLMQAAAVATQELLHEASAAWTARTIAGPLGKHIVRPLAFVKLEKSEAHFTEDMTLDDMEEAIAQSKKQDGVQLTVHLVAVHTINSTRDLNVLLAECDFENYDAAVLYAEPAQGVSLATLLREHYVRRHEVESSKNLCLSVMRPVLDTLQRLHETGVVHGSVSPLAIRLLVDNDTWAPDDPEFGRVASLRRRLNSCTSLRQFYALLSEGLPVRAVLCDFSEAAVMSSTRTHPRGSSAGEVLMLDDKSPSRFFEQVHDAYAARHDGTTGMREVLSLLKSIVTEDPLRHSCLPLRARHVRGYTAPEVASAQLRTCLGDAMSMGAVLIAMVFGGHDAAEGVSNSSYRERDIKLLHEDISLSVYMNSPIWADVFFAPDWKEESPSPFWRRYVPEKALQCLQLYSNSECFLKALDGLTAYRPVQRLTIRQALRILDREVVTPPEFGTNVSEL
ncbi:MAG: hypothetical protein MHM6MM_008610 [Cercozoa sp. M6MM]